MDDIWIAIKQIGPLKAPALDSMHANFCQKCWNVIGKSIYNMAKAFLHHGHLLRNHITFIPKKENHFKVNDFRPIIICNVSYKFISKLVANRLRAILPKIISPLQIVFVHIEVFIIIF